MWPFSKPKQVIPTAADLGVQLFAALCHEYRKPQTGDAPNWAVRLAELLDRSFPASMLDHHLKAIDQAAGHLPFSDRVDVYDALEEVEAYFGFNRTSVVEALAGVE